MNMEDEVICGYLVTSAQKHMNAVFLEMLQEFDRLCKANNITWWMNFGGLIGAVRHHGFIPWDDDIDVIVPRRDFDRLLCMTNEQFGASYPYFLQNPVNDPGNADTLLRLRRSDTTCIRPVDYEDLLKRKEPVPYNMGQCLAIFPLDIYPRSPLVQKLMVKTAGILAAFLYRAYEPPTDKPVKYLICHTALKVLGPKNLMSLRHWPYRWCRKNRSGKVHVFAHCYTTSTVFDADDFAGTVQLPFETITVPAPIGYDSMLTECYGDYMTFPPVEERGNGGHKAYESYNTPYTVSIEKLRSGEITFPGTKA